MVHLETDEAFITAIRHNFFLITATTCIQIKQ